MRALDELDVPSRTGLCSGILNALRMPDAQFGKLAGMDALIFVEFVRLCLRILGGFALFGAASLARTASRC